MRTPPFSALALTLLLAFDDAYALSANSPRDMLAYPAYRIRLNPSNPISNSSAHSILASFHSPPSGAPSELAFQTPKDAFDPLEHPDNVSPAYRPYLMRAGGNRQGYLCNVPEDHSSERVQVKEGKRETSQLVLSQDEKLERRRKAEEDRKLAYERGIELLEPLKGSCLYYTQGWFTYSFCHGQALRQFHGLRVPPTSANPHGIAEDPAQDTYVLGTFSQRLVETEGLVDTNKARSLGSLREVLDGEDRDYVIDGQSSELSHWSGADSLAGQKNYLVQNWGGGSVCDKTGVERKVEVQFHCSSQTTDRIFLIRETAICEYVIVIHTPRLCGDTTFVGSSSSSQQSYAQKKKKEVNIVECRPIVRDQLYEEWLHPQTSEEVHATHQHISDTEQRSTIGEMMNEKRMDSNLDALLDRERAKVETKYGTREGLQHDQTAQEHHEPSESVEDEQGSNEGQEEEAADKSSSVDAADGPEGGDIGDHGFSDGLEEGSHDTEVEHESEELPSSEAEIVDYQSFVLHVDPETGKIGLSRDGEDDASAETDILKALNVNENGEVDLEELMAVFKQGVESILSEAIGKGKEAGGSDGDGKQRQLTPAEREEINQKMLEIRERESREDTRRGLADQMREQVRRQAAIPLNEQAAALADSIAEGAEARKLKAEEREELNQKMLEIRERESRESTRQGIKDDIREQVRRQAAKPLNERAAALADGTTPPPAAQDAFDPSLSRLRKRNFAHRDKTGVLPMDDPRIVAMLEQQKKLEKEILARKLQHQSQARSNTQELKNDQGRKLGTPQLRNMKKAFGIRWDDDEQADEDLNFERGQAKTPRDEL